MADTKKPKKPLTELEKQFLPMQGEPSPVQPNRIENESFSGNSKSQGKNR